MNLHPIIVHFPIALLSIYAVMELVRFKRLNQQPYWFYIKASLLILGTIGAVAATASGDTARHVVLSGSDGNVHLAQNLRAIISFHESFGKLTTLVFAALSACYFVAWVNKTALIKMLRIGVLQKLWNLATTIQKFVIDTWFVLLPAIAGLFLVLATGALGGLIVYGPNEDPATKLAYQLIVGQQQNQQQTQAANPNTLTYKNLNYNFEFQYPKDWGFAQPSYYNLQEPIVQVQTPPNSYPKTNFGDAAFAVSWAPATSQQDCLNQGSPDIGPSANGQKPFSQTVQINGTTFYTASGTGAGAGNFYDSRIFRYYQQKFCFEITETIHTTNIYNYDPGTVTEINTSPIWTQLNNILNTFKFDQAQQPNQQQ